jgi:hypothetical protein
MKTENEKPMGEIARIAFEMTPHTPLDEPWANAATAVIAEHERRKAAAILGSDILASAQSGIATYLLSATDKAIMDSLADPNAECKKAYSAGKRIQFKYKHDDDSTFRNADNPVWHAVNKYRVHPDDVEPKPDPVMVPLGPEDVPPGTVLRGAGETGDAGWCMIVSCSLTGIRLWHANDASPHEIKWQHIFESNSEINRNDGKGWCLCSKEVQP